MREAAVMLIIKDGLILAISYRNDKTKFGLPGGKCEPNETPMEASIRETLEETGITVNKCCYVFSIFEPKDTPLGEDFYCHCYYAIDWSGLPSNSEEGIVKWLLEEELTGETGAFADYNKRALEALKLLKL